MRILIASDTFAPHINGAARFTERLGQGLVRRGHEVHQVVPSTGLNNFTEVIDGMTVHRVRSVAYWGIDNFRCVMPWDSYPFLPKLIADIEPDIIHIQTSAYVGRVAANYATKHRIPLVATNHFMPENAIDQLPLPRLVKRATTKALFWDMHHVYSKAQVLTAPTPRATEILAESAGLLGGVPVSNGVDSEVYAKAAAAARPNEVPRILYVGRLDPEKHVNELIEAVAGLPADVPYRVEIIGIGGQRDEWHKLSVKLGVDDKVIFRGFVEEADLVTAYGSCDIFCIPGVAELQSLVTLEAMSASKPVVAANAMALPHLVRPGENGFLYEPGDIEELRAHLQRLLTDAEERKRMGAVSKQLVAVHAIAGTLQTFEDLYEKAKLAVGR